MVQLPRDPDGSQTMILNFRHFTIPELDFSNIVGKDETLWEMVIVAMEKFNFGDFGFDGDVLLGPIGFLRCFNIRSI